MKTLKDFYKTITEFANKFDISKAYSMSVEDGKVRRLQGMFNPYLLSEVYKLKHDAYIDSSGFLTVETDDTDFVFTDGNPKDAGFKTGHFYDVVFSVLDDINHDISDFKSLQWLSGGVYMYTRQNNGIINACLATGWEVVSKPDSRIVSFEKSIDGTSVRICVFST